MGPVLGATDVPSGEALRPGNWYCSGTPSDFSATVSRRNEGGAEHVLIKSQGSEEWLVYRGTTTPDPRVLDLLGEAWAKAETVRWAVAAPLDEAGQPRTDRTFPLHVYFPTEEAPGLHVIVHAEWVLSMDRRKLAEIPEATPTTSCSSTTSRNSCKSASPLIW
jgi:hypothetical protein